jgi:hypothetical protein
MWFTSMLQEWGDRLVRLPDARWREYNDQDAFFWNALEVIARELNAQIALQRAKMLQAKHEQD